MQVETRLSRWCLFLCLTSTIIYTMLLMVFPLIILSTPSAMLFLFPLSVPVCLSFIWLSYGREQYGRARLLCFIPAITLAISALFA